MLAEPIRYALLAALAIALLIAAFTDLKSRRISNSLNAVIALGAPLFWLASGLSLWPEIALQIALALGTFSILVVLFAIRAMGGGDVKLLTALALWIAPALFLKLIVATALLGGLLTLALGIWHVMGRRKDRLMVPYGVAIACAGLWVITADYVAKSGAPALVG